MEEIFDGLNFFISNYRPKVFNYDALKIISTSNFFIKDELYKIVKLQINSRIYDPLEVEFLCLIPNDGIYKWMGKNYYSPFVLIEKPEQLKEQVKNMDLKNFFVIPGYFLDKAIQIMSSYDRALQFKDESELFEYMISANLSTVEIGTKIHKIDPESKRFVRIPSLFELDESNPLLKISNTRKVVYHGSVVADTMRYPHKSHLGKIDLLESPESEEIGLSLFLSLGARYNAKKLAIDSDIKSSNDFFSYSTLLVPFLTYNDTPRAMMGGKNLKQAIRVVGSEKPIVKTGIEDQIGFDLGVNAFVGYALFDGLNFEDGIVASKSFSQKMKIESREELKIEDEVPLPIDYEIIESGRSTKKFVIQSKVQSGKSIEIVYEFVKTQNVVYGDLYLRRRVFFDGNENKDLKRSFLFDQRYTYTLNITKDCFEIGDITPPLVKEMISMSHLTIRIPVKVEKPLEVGDKITGRYGNKGTISRILEDEEMPYVEIDGKKKILDLILSPFGIITRMNLGQLIETHGTLVNFTDGSVDSKVDPDKLISQLKALGGDENGKFPLHVKVNGKETVFSAIVGYQYFVRLDHCVRDKLHVIGHTKHISEITFQPYKGRKNNGGQRIGEMEFWTLFDHKAIPVIQLFAKTNLTRWKEYYKYLNSFNTLLDEYHNFTIRPLKEGGKLFVQKLDGLKDDKNEEILDMIKDRKGKAYKEAKFLISKDGFPRTAMLGRRIHYSGRATIVPATDIDVDHVYLPVDFALEWFNLKFENERSILEGDMIKRREFADIANSYCKLNEIMVLLNRQPSLHLHSIQAFYPIFWENYAIGLPIMVCEGFGADFDGDTMAVYYPSDQNEKIRSTMKKMTPSNHLFKIGNRDFSISISQDMTYGNYLKDKNSNLSEKIKEIILSHKDVPEKLLDIQKEMLEIATSQNLSVSFFEAKGGMGDIKKIEESKARGKAENFQSIYKEIKIGDQNIGNFSNGIPLEFYIGNGLENFDSCLAVRGRKSMLDKKLHVAEAGYFTRKMVEFLYPLRISSHDCGTNEGIEFTKTDIEKLVGKYDIERIINGRYIKFKEDEEWVLVNFDNLKEMKEKATDGFILRSPVTCKSENGPCEKCCGINPSTSDESFRIGDFIGVISGHTIGERGTQLSMKTFQTSKSDFKMSAVSSRFFRRMEKSFVDYLVNLANEDLIKLMTGKDSDKKEWLLKTIDVSSIYLEILFMYMKNNKIETEGQMKKYLTDLKNYGFFSALSFENPPGKKENGIKKSNIAKAFEKIDRIEERSPKSIYALLPDEVEAILDGKE
ncbi:DNA-directed RNA polymerase subunit beta [Athalassotoga saccharophila]|uniref:DNA-directed RNA polymerase subunit beta n=1 Tax=Athalassotoga saccharophila TaxID=1441386 RepID=UPI00137A07ED|nr:DNA-directed RNA polymerase subunit beta [Athalassotoga saccharophila]BBJ28684.1 DNA-directed RNA polymerase subunit beta [Athalassotoga saccharophila]